MLFLFLINLLLTPGLFSQSRFVCSLFILSRACPWNRERESMAALILNSIKNLLFKRWWSMFSRYVVKIQDLVPRRILFHLDHKIRKHNIITILSSRSSKYTLKRKGSIEVRRFIYRIMRSFYGFSLNERMNLVLMFNFISILWFKQVVNILYHYK